MSFSSLGLSAPLLQAVSEQGYETPTPIQDQAIPAVLQGKDVMAAAQTGTGKTAGFTLPILEILAKGTRAKPNQARTLILTPTRELAAQINDSVISYGKHLPLRSTVVFGGVKINPQMIQLRKGVDVLVATPGRLLDLYRQNAVKFKSLEVLVLDEADRMLDMGFIHDIRKIIAALPRNRQTLMFSATFSQEIEKLAKTLVSSPIKISITPKQKTVKAIKHWFSPVDKKRKALLLIHLIEENKWEQALVFTRTKRGANQLTARLEKKNISALAIHGNKSQSARTKALAAFKAGKVKILVATDIAARGLDIDQLPQVVNYDLPTVAEDYVHRIGRTGRAGATGQAISLVSADEYKQLGEIERLINQTIPREYVAGFEPVNDVPAARPDKKPKRPKKPKKSNPWKKDTERSAGSEQGKKNSTKATTRKGQKSPVKKRR